MKSNRYTHREHCRTVQRPARTIPRDNDGSGTTSEMGQHGRLYRKDNTIRARNQEELVGLILTSRRVSSVVFQLKFLYCQKKKKR